MTNILALIQNLGQDKVNNLIVNTHLDMNFATNKGEFDVAMKDILPDLVIMESNFESGNQNAHSFLKEIKNKYHNCPVLILTEHDDLKHAVGLIDAGADDLVEAPLSKAKFLRAISTLLHIKQLQSDNAELGSLLKEEANFIGSSKQVGDLLSQVMKATKSNSKIIIHGEIGTEKIHIANFIHHYSKRKNGSLVSFNCGDRDQVEERLFGGYDSKTSERIIGALEKASKGTLVLKEFQGLPLICQNRLVELVKENARKTDVRIIATTSTDIDQLVTQDILNKNFLHMMEGSRIHVPSLRNRREDIGDLAKHYIKKCSSDLGYGNATIADTAIIALQSYGWPGNIYQFKNLMNSLYISAIQQSENKEIVAEMIPSELFTENSANVNPVVNYEIMSMDLRAARSIFEQQYIKAQIERFGGNISHTASFIGMERTALHRKLSTLDINSDDVRSVIKGYKRKKVS